MSVSMSSKPPATLTLLWIARLTGTLAIVPLMLIAFGEPGSGPRGAREWIYLALFPFGFSIGYLLGWRWPLLGGCLSLACLGLSLVVIGRVFGLAPYLIWAILAIPGILYIVAGLRLRRTTAIGEQWRSSEESREL